MHRIIKAHLNSFVLSQGLEADDEALQFEKFAAYCVISSRYSASFDLDDVSTGAGEDGIDGVAIVIDEAVTTSAEDAKAIFAAPRGTATLIFNLFKPSDQMVLISVIF